MRKATFIAIFIIVTGFLTGCKKSSAPDPRDVFVATYSVSESWTENGQALTKPAFAMSIEKSTQYGDRLLLTNFANYGAGVIVEATMNGKTIAIAQQTLSNLKVITGSGTLSDPTLTITYTESINSISNSITAVAKKK